MQSLDIYLGLDDTHWSRDRIMFFENCGPGCRDIPGINRSDGTARTGGYYRYKEGTGPVYPLLMGRSVGHIRRYRRGKCSSEIPLNDFDISRMIANTLRDKVECSASIWSTSIIDSYAELFIGTSNCKSVDGEDQDYVHIYYKVRIVPAHYIANAYFTYEQDLWMQIGARRRVQLLNCPEQGECPSDICEDCRKCEAVACRDDWGCCDIPGAVCTDTAVYGAECNSSGYCEKRSFLDIIDYDFSHDWDVTRECAWNWWCLPTALGFWVEAGGVNPLKDIFYPLLQRLYDMIWQKPPESEWWLFPCAANDDTICRMWEDDNIQGRCDVSNGVCEFRPMYIYGMNIYPAAAEAVLAWDDSYDEVAFLNMGGKCDEVPYPANWSLLSNEWLE